MVKVTRKPDPFHPPYYDLDEYYVSLATSGTAKTYTDKTAWTPALAFGAGSTGIVYTAQTGSYAQLGNVVFVQGRIALSSKGTSTGTATVSLPVAADGFNPLSIARELNFTGLTGALRIYGTGASIFFRQTSATGAASSNLTDTSFTDTTDLSFSGVYFV